MVIIMARISANDGAAGQLRQVLMDLVAPSRGEPGCVSYELFQDAESALDFITLEHWADSEAADTHMATAHVAAAIAAAGPLLAQSPVIHRFTQLA